MGTPLRLPVLLALVLLVLCVDAHAQSFDGNWTGTTSQGKTLSFNVLNNAVTTITVGAFLQGGACTLDVIIYRPLDAPGSIVDNGFSAAATGGSGVGEVSYTITGTFGSSTSVSGNLMFTHPGCELSATATWSAAKSSDTPIFRLTVLNLGNNGTVTSSPAGIDCGDDCSEEYASGTAVTLVATPADGAYFGGWGGSCFHPGVCTLTMTENKGVVAEFGLLPADLVTAGVNQAEFRTGDQIITSLAMNNPGLSHIFLTSPLFAEFYIGLLLPDGDTIAFFTPNGTVSGRASDLGSLVPLATYVPLTSSFIASVPDFFTHRWSGAEPAGTYYFFIVITHAGALADGELDPSDILTVRVASFTFQP